MATAAKKIGAAQKKQDSVNFNIPQAKTPTKHNTFSIMLRSCANAKRPREGSPLTGRSAV